MFPDVNCTDVGYETTRPQLQYLDFPRYRLALRQRQRKCDRAFDDAIAPDTGIIYDSDVELNSEGQTFTTGLDVIGKKSPAERRSASVRAFSRPRPIQRTQLPLCMHIWMLAMHRYAHWIPTTLMSSVPRIHPAIWTPLAILNRVTVFPLNANSTKVAAPSLRATAIDVRG